MSQLDAGLSVQQRFRIAKARSQRLLKDWDESKHPRVPAGGPDGGQFGEGGGGSEGSEKPSGGKSKKPAKKEDFDKAKIKIGALSNQAEFIDKWNAKIGIEPEEFKKNFMGGADGTMTVSASSSQFHVEGTIEDNGKQVGIYTRYINPDTKTAQSAYFKLDKTATKHDIGKKMLAGNVETYKNLGIEKVEVTANIDVGGYAWAKYGYVPTASAWSALRGELERKLTGGSASSSSSRNPNAIEADDWDQLSSDTQDDVRDRWMRDSRDEFISSEEQNWRESGQALEDSKNRLVDLYNDRDIPEWASDAFDAVRETREDAGDPPIPYTNQQLFAAISLDYKSKYGDGRDDPEVTFDDNKLQEPQGHDPAQGTLPGIEPLDPSQMLSQPMRDQLESEMIDSFNKKAESDADEMDAPEYLADSVSEYQDEYWDQKSDSEKLRHAIDYGMADIEIEPDEEEEPPQHEMELPKTEDDPVLAAVRSSDPKSIWKVADSPQGKSLLLGTGWSGVLNLKDKDSMDRFNKYVGKNA